jgi:hypothetical protein
MSTDPLNSFERTIHNTGAEVKDRVTDFASKVKDTAGQMAETVSGKLAQPRESAADGLHRAASSLHDNADAVPGGAKAVNLTHSLADGMESTASYLRDHDLSKMGQDVMDVCRRYPTQSLVAALAVGFLIGRSRRS